MDRFENVEGMSFNRNSDALFAETTQQLENYYFRIHITPQESVSKLKSVLEVGAPKCLHVF